ncbi:sensor histidine kinase [Paenibacillus sp. JX-17]|uniref:Oxygen sensor histidine kinase NreB n=1 Tax=Paenibacillus lacisoli TaxID=3064525 RepID=A0ABT9CDR4_9BACL|nr:sensor histidine kinase [Paenibacillus sp. JX-17]MDO7907366.1 sensor histidine kinase [Paenibacillus sp. JX-17]
MIKNTLSLFKTAKWELLTYFLLTGAVSALALYMGYWNGYIRVTDTHVWLLYILSILIATAVIGYIAGIRIQRRIDMLDLNMLQVTKGNLSVRMPETGDRSFARVYHEFNTMMDAMEKKMRLLQRFGEQEVLEKEQSAERAVLEERRRLARDLHDTVSQQLFAIHMSASALPKVLEASPEQGKQVMDQLISISQSAQKQMRALIAQLRPVELQGKCLAEALDGWFPDYCRQNGLKGIKELDLQGDLSEAIEHQLFLIIQEAMANIVKHADARLVSLFLREGERHVSMSLSDDGQGFQQSETRQGSYGLMTMRERAEKLGGQVAIVSKPGAGTTIRVHIPIYKDEQAEVLDRNHDIPESGEEPRKE